MADSGNRDHGEFDGRHVRTIREARRLTQAQLAGRVGITRNALSMIEGGRVFPKLRTLFAIARELDVAVADLVGGSREQTVDPEFQPLVDALSKVSPRTRRVFLSSQTELVEQIANRESRSSKNSPGATPHRKHKGAQLRVLPQDDKPSKGR